MEKTGKFFPPLDSKPALENADNFCAADFFERRREMAWLRPLDLRDDAVPDDIDAKLLGENREQFVDQRQTFRIVLALRLADEIMNPKIAFILERSPRLFSATFSRKRT